MAWSRLRASWDAAACAGQLIRESVYVFAAVAPVSGELVSLILPEACTAMMNLFLEHVSRTFAKSFIVMQVDGAAWHDSQELVVPANIRLIEQPPYSPELNPAEHLWEEPREKYLHNRAFPPRCLGRALPLLRRGNTPRVSPQPTSPIGPTLGSGDVHRKHAAIFAVSFVTAFKEQSTSALFIRVDL